MSIKCSRKIVVCPGYSDARYPRTGIGCFEQARDGRMVKAEAETVIARQGWLIARCTDNYT
jgi:hypothetical protein